MPREGPGPRHRFDLPHQIPECIVDVDDSRRGCLRACVAAERLFMDAFAQRIVAEAGRIQCRRVAGLHDPVLRVEGQLRRAHCKLVSHTAGIVCCSRVARPVGRRGVHVRRRQPVLRKAGVRGCLPGITILVEVETLSPSAGGEEGHGGC
jgi:hypothetical protein